MARTIDSVVASVGSERKVAKASGKTFFVHSVTTEDGETIEVGFKQKYKVGDRINVDVDTKFGKLTEVGPPSGVPSKPTAAAVSGQAEGFSKQAKVFPVPELSGEMAIIRQNALTNAVNVVLNKTGVLIPANAAKSEREQTLDSVSEDIIRLAYKFADFSSGHREAKVARERARLADTPSE